MITSQSMRLGKKNSTNLEELDYLQDLNKMLFSNVVDQAAQKTEYYLGQEQLQNHWHTYVFFSTWTLSATDVHRHVSHGFNDTNEIGGGFYKSPMNYMVHQAWTSCATLAHLFLFPK